MNAAPKSQANIENNAVNVGSQPHENAKQHGIMKEDSIKTTPIINDNNFSILLVLNDYKIKITYWYINRITRLCSDCLL